jgi:NADPH-dependent glutamate synthase beta subunit-like oxidoreductase
MRGTDFLECINSNDPVKLGKETIVIGGGNTAMDVARSALRLGSRVTVAYRRTRNEMPAIPDEIGEAEEEGVRFSFLIQPVKIRLTAKKRLAVTFQRMKLGPADQSNRPKAVPIKGKYVTVEADNVITAAGELVDLSWIPRKLVKNSLIDVSYAPKIFAGGDAVAQPRSLANAIASGKKAAISMDLFHRGEDSHDALRSIGRGDQGSLSMEAYLQGRREGKWPEAKQNVSYERIKTLFFETAKRLPIRKLSRDKRLKGFFEVNLGYDARKAEESAMRCFSCGMCNYCNNCSLFCPEGAIIVDPDRGMRSVKYNYCKGCGTCAQACPRSALDMKDQAS